jgi:hypothetical protein
MGCVARVWCGRGHSVCLPPPEDRVGVVNQPPGLLGQTSKSEGNLRSKKMEKSTTALVSSLGTSRVRLSAPSRAFRWQKGDLT